MHELLRNLESFFHNRDELPTLIHAGIAHAQFETIHPFLDGNGRVGRLLITLLLCERNVLQQPLLYLSYYLKVHRARYYDRLMAIRHDGDWEGWLKFFLRGVSEVSQAATDTACAIINLREKHRHQASQVSTDALNLLYFLYKKPIITIRMAQSELGCAYRTAAKVVESLEE